MRSFSQTECGGGVDDFQDKSIIRRGCSCSKGNHDILFELQGKGSGATPKMASNGPAFLKNVRKHIKGDLGIVLNGDDDDNDGSRTSLSMVNPI